MESQSENAPPSRKKHEFGFAGLGVIVTILIAVAGGGYKAGLVYAEADAKVQSVGLREANSKWQAELTVAQAKVSDLTGRLAERNAAHEKGLAEIERQRTEMKVLMDRLGKLGNCTFIHERILALQQEIDHPGIRVIGTSGEEVSEKNLQLRQSLADYRQLLASCQQ